MVPHLAHTPTLTHTHTHTHTSSSSSALHTQCDAGHFDVSYAVARCWNLVVVERFRGRTSCDYTVLVCGTNLRSEDTDDILGRPCHASAQCD